MSNNRHVVVEVAASEIVFRCRHCGGTEGHPTPRFAWFVVKILDAFRAWHEDCHPQANAPAKEKP